MSMRGLAVVKRFMCHILHTEYFNSNDYNM